MRNAAIRGCLIVLLATCACFVDSTALAVIYTCSIQPIPGTEDITPGPGVVLREWNTAERNLRHANFRTVDLTGADFELSWLDHACFDQSNLTVANLASTQLTGANLSLVNAPNAVFEGAVLFSADISFADLAGANLRNADLRATQFLGTVLANADLSGALIDGASFAATTPGGLSPQQFYSTASYQDGNLQEIILRDNDLSTWNFTEKDLSGATFLRSDLNNASLDGAVMTSVELRDAIITGTSFGDTTARGFVEEQLRATVSFRSGMLAGIGLQENDLSGWQFRRLDLTGSRFFDSTLVNANFTEAKLAGANLARADATTSSFAAADLSNADLSGVNLSMSDLNGATLTGAVFTRADLSLADLRNAVGAAIDGADLSNTIRPDGSILGLDLASGQTLFVRDHNDDLFLPAITVSEHFRLAEESTLRLSARGKDSESLFSFAPGIPVEIDGTLELSLPGDTPIQLFNWSGVNRTGEFDVANANFFDLSRLYTTGEVTRIGPRHGDTDGDHDVDIDDLNNVRNNFGESGPGVLGDTNGDGVINIDDLGNVRNAFGTGPPRPVAEPGSLLLLASVLPIYLARRRTRSRSCAHWKA